MAVDSMFLSIGRRIILLGVLLLPVNHVVSDSTPGNSLVSALLEGGYILYFRHEATDWSQSDHVGKANDWLSCDVSRMRQLSETGRKRAISTGDAIRSIDIPIGLVLASPYCRALETARLMNLGTVTTTTDVVNLRVAGYFGDRAAMVSRAKALLATPPGEGTNTVIVAHGNVAREATPVYPDEGEAAVFQPDGQGGFRYIGRLTAEDWVQLKH